MDLADFVADLQRIGKETSLVRLSKNGTLERRITLPNFLEEGKVDLPYKIRLGEQREPPYKWHHLTISANVGQKTEEFDAIVNRIFRNCRRRLPFANRTSYHVSWSPEQMLDESVLPRDKRWIEAVARTHIVGSPHERMSFSETSLEATCHNNHLRVKAKGNYRRFFPELVEGINASQVVLNVGDQDVEILKKGLRKHPASYLMFEVQMKRQPRRLLEGFIEPRTSYDIKIMASELPVYEEALGHTILSASEEQHTNIKELMKSYRLPFFRQKRRLHDLQVIAKKMISIREQAELNGSSGLSPKLAAEILEREIQHYEKFFREEQFDDSCYFSDFDTLMRLANCYVGESIPYYDDVKKSVEALRRQGYKPGSISMEKSSETTKVARHFLEFIKQMFSNDKETFVRNFVEYYRNHPPEVEFSTIPSVPNYKKIFGYSIPERGVINGFSVRNEHPRGFSNDVSLWYVGFVSVRDDLVIGENATRKFKLTVSIDKPDLLPLQTYVCDELGIRFS